MNAVRQLSTGGESQEQKLHVSAQPEAASSWAQSIKANIGKVQSFLRKNSAILTILGAGVIGAGSTSCGEDGPEQNMHRDDMAVGTIDSYQRNIESGEPVPLANRTAKLTFDNADWHFEGTFPRDFVLKVYADDRLVYDDVVVVTPNGQVEGQSMFKVQGLGINPENTKRIKAQPFEVDQDGTEGKAIPLNNHPPANGMLGNAEIGNLGVL